MFKFKSQNSYWTEFSSYRTFQSVDQMIEQIKIFESTYELTPSVKAVLNTIKLHAKRFIGVCWLYREEIARKAGASLSSVKRAIKALHESGILTIHPFTHTKRGGKTHNIYVINPIFETSEDPSNEPSVEQPEEQSKPCPATVCESASETHKNSHKNSNNSLNHLSINEYDVASGNPIYSNVLKFIPNEFIDLMEPFYANNPEIIRDRWKTTCVAVKKSCVNLSYTSWDTIGQAWKDVVKFHKRGKIKDSSEDGLGGYFYGVLCDYLIYDYVRHSQNLHTPL